MQQVFSSMNVFLRNQKQETPSDRKLRLVTYSCIPLSPAAGVLQWVDETIAIGQFLTTSRIGAHERYYPGEWSNSLCRRHMAHSPQSSKRAAFDEVCKHFSPAFRFFFLERFSHSPQLWYNARMAYTRSCAVNSLVGHILGTSKRLQKYLDLLFANLNLFSF
jgi:ataxia telangiectasia mutated family protein